MKFLLVVVILAMNGCMYPHPHLFKPDPDQMMKVLHLKRIEAVRQAEEMMPRPREREMIEGEVDQVG